jgi:hypothetical protein
MGVTNPGYRPDDEGATAFPSLIALGSSFNPQLVRQGGEAIGREARVRGFNVQLAGGCNLARDPRRDRPRGTRVRPASSGGPSGQMSEISSMSTSDSARPPESRA